MDITGYIWQEYPEDFPGNFVKGIIFPEEVNSTDTSLRELYKTTQRKHGIQYEVIGWYFDVTVRQSFDYSHYPLDKLTVWLQLCPRDLVNEDKIILIPDFHSCSRMNEPIFGRDEEIVSGEWEIDETFFSY